MKRRPSLFRRTPPSPRTPSVTRMPRTLGGQTMPVGWNCTNSMSISSAPGVIGERVAVAGVLPAVARDLVGAADAAGREHDRLRAEDLEAAALAVVAERAGDAVAVLEQRRATVNSMWTSMPLVDAVVLQRADHLEAGAVADVREARIAVAAEVALQDAAVRRAIEHRAPRLELAHAVGRLPARAARPCASC